MSKSGSGLFHGTTGEKAVQKGFPVNGEDYNTAHSNSVQKVDSVSEVHNSHSIPSHGTPNSVSRNYKDGRVSSERYYDEKGNAYLDIDYSNHGNAKIHPNVPHEHSIHFGPSGKMIRDDSPDGGINR